MPIEFLNLDQNDIESTRDLWLGLHRHHFSVAPELAPYASDQESWDVRKAECQSFLKNDGAIIGASTNSGIVGFVAARTQRMPWPATFRTAPIIMEITGLSVSSEMQDQDIAGQLLDKIDLHAEATGHKCQMVGIASGNAKLVALFEQRGFKPAWLTLTNFGRPWPELSDTDGIPIHHVTPEEVGMLRDIWLAVHRHHQVVSPELAPFVDDDESWAVFEPIFKHAAEEGLLLAAGPKDIPYGLACVEIVKDRKDFSATWKTGRAVAEIEVMAVNIEMRGRGVGSALLSRIFGILRERKVHDCCVGAIHGNKGAIRLYERTGFRPAWIEMTRFG